MQFTFDTSGNKDSSTGFTFGDTKSSTGGGFSFDTTGTGFTFGDTKSSTETSTGFSFGEKTTTEKSTDGGFSFNFGGDKTSTTETKSSTNLGFTFGETSTTQPTTTTEFKFDAPKKDEKTEKKEEPTGFTFGSTSTSEKDKKESASTEFSFGSSSGFTFGSTSTSGEFKFDAAPKKDEKTDKKEESTGFTFGTSTSETRKEKEKKESTGTEFSFGSTSGFTFGSTSTSGEKKDETKQTETGFTFGGGEKKEEKKTETTTGFGDLGDQTGTTPTEILSLKNKTVEQIINKWNTELEEDVSSFMKLAGRVYSWDKMLLQNEEKIVNLYNEVKKVGVQQNELDSNLDMIVSQQNDLEKMLDAMEKRVDILYNSTKLTPPDEERANTYELANSIDQQLNQMSLTLKDMINKLNEAYDKSVDPENKVTQITKILDSHLGALQWIDLKISELQMEIEKASSEIKEERINELKIPIPQTLLIQEMPLYIPVGRRRTVDNKSIEGPGSIFEVCQTKSTRVYTIETEITQLQPASPYVKNKKRKRESTYDPFQAEVLNEVNHVWTIQVKFCQQGAYTIRFLGKNEKGVTVACSETKQIHVFTPEKCVEMLERRIKQQQEEMQKMKDYYERKVLELKYEAVTQNPHQVPVHVVIPSAVQATRIQQPVIQPPSMPKMEQESVYQNEQPPM